MVRCKLGNTIDSSNITTPIVALVTDDLVWGGKVIIAKCSEVHGIAQVDKSRECVDSSMLAEVLIEILELVPRGVGDNRLFGLLQLTSWQLENGNNNPRDDWRSLFPKAPINDPERVLALCSARMVCSPGAPELLSLLLQQTRSLFHWQLSIV
jgi:hypothetical protein